MKKFITIIFIYFIFITGISNVYAACDFIETNRLSSLAVNVKASYEVIEVELPKDSYTPPDDLSEEKRATYKAYTKEMHIHITNLTEELYIIVYNKETGAKTRYDFQNDGSIDIKTDNIYTMYNYTITVYSSDKTDCPDTKLFTTYITTPYYNMLSEYTMCEGIEEYYLCHEFLTVESVPFDEFVVRAQKYKTAKEEKNEQPEEPKEFKLSEHIWLIVLLSLGVILVGTVSGVIIVKKKRRKKFHEKEN